MKHRLPASRPASVAAAAFWLLGAMSWLQGQNRVQLSLSSEIQQVVAGDRFEVAVEARVEHGWHMYSMTQPEGGPIATTIEVLPGDAFRQVDKVVHPPVRKFFDENFGIETEFVEGDAEFLIPMEALAAARPGEHPLQVQVRFMVCSDTMCLPPQTKKMTISLRVAAEAAPVSPSSGTALRPPASSQNPPLVGLGSTIEKIQFSLNPPKAAVSAGDASAILLHVQVEEGWHLYSMTQKEGGPIPTTIRIADNPAFELWGEIQQPPIRTVYDPNFEMDAEFIDGGDFTIPFRVRDDAPPGTHPLTLEIRYMVCSDTMCLPPRNLTLDSSVAVSEPSSGGTSRPGTSGLDGAAAAIAAPNDSVQPGASAAGQLPEEFWRYLGFAMLMGGLALLTPCVFPMIPITVSYFTKREAVSRGTAIKEAGIYALGIVLTFTLLGFSLTFLLGAGGINRLAASPLINLVIASIFVVFALSLFGLLEIRMPAKWVNAIDRKSSNTSGIIGILLMALAFSLTSFTCTVPFVGTVMVAALQGDWLWSLLGVTAFATIFAIPFFLLAVFPSWLQSLPASGNWMNSMKITMGFVELAAALKFLSNIDLVFQWEILTRPVFITVWLAISIVTTAYLFGWLRFRHEPAVEGVGGVRILSAVFFLSISFYLLRGLFGFSLGELDSFLPPRDYGGVESFSFAGVAQHPSQELEWETDYQAALRRAQVEGKPVFIDFTGYTCTNCRWMEANMFPLPEIEGLFRKMILVRLYTDGGEPEHDRNLGFEQERFGTIALPLYAIMSAEDEVLEKHEGMTRDKAVFADFLKRGLTRHDLAKMARR